MSKLFIDAGEVAEILGVKDREAFLRRRADLEKDHEFPLPMPQLLRPMLWRRSQVVEWAENYSADRQPDAPRITPEDLGRGNVVSLMKLAASA